MDSKAAFIEAIVEAADCADPKQGVASQLEQSIAVWDGHAPWQGVPTSGGFEVLHASSSLTIMHLIWPPGLITEPHTHSMWAVIGLFLGRENNMLWERAGTSIQAHSSISLAAGDVCAFEADLIHSVHNPLDQFTGAIHVYGGDFINTPNTEFDPLTLVERPRDMAEQMDNFARG